MPEEDTVPEEEKLCPYLNAHCLKFGCKRYVSTQVVEFKLGVPMPKRIYLCMDAIMLGQLQTMSNLLQALLQGRTREIKLPPGFQGPKG